MGQGTDVAGRPGSSVSDVVRDIVAEEAPAELPVAEGLRRLGDDGAGRRLARRRRRREPLGFGLGEVVPLVTPVLWIALDETVRRGADDVADGLLAWELQLLRRAFRRQAPQRPVGPFTQGQLQFLRKRARELALEYGHNRKDAEALAERLAARIILRQEVPERGSARGAARVGAQDSYVMAGTVAGPQADVRAMGMGTAPRFVLLVILLLVSSCTMIRFGINGQFGSERFDGIGCLFASGACAARYRPQSPWWFFAWAVLLLLAVGALYRILTAWKVRPSRVVPLEGIDGGGEILVLVRELAEVAGLIRPPRVVVDPASASTSATVFGRNRRPTLRLHGGLLTLRFDDPERFRAVILHEFAYIRNGDVTRTYVTAALWRVFLALVLLPYAAWNITLLAVATGSADWSSAAPGVAHGLMLALFMVALACLARSDVMRSREICAGLAAIRWGVSPHLWASTVPAPTRGTLGRAFDSFIGLWRTNPRWGLRRDALTDPAVMSGVRAAPMFLTGAAAALINSQLWPYPGNYGLGSTWAAKAAALAAAGLVTGVAGIALWQAVAHAALAMYRMPTGVRAGLWLGAGMAAGEWVTGQVALNQWLPSQPGGALLAVLVGTVYAWWTTQGARSQFRVRPPSTIRRTRTRPGRALRLAMMLRLTIAYVLLSLWFTWRPDYGAMTATAERAARWLFTFSELSRWWWPAFLAVAWAVMVLRGAIGAITASRRAAVTFPRATAARALASSARSGRREAFWDGFTDLAVFARQQVTASAGESVTEALHAAYNQLGPPPGPDPRDLSSDPGNPLPPPAFNGGRPRGEARG